MRIVNTNYKTKINPIDLNTIKSYFENSKLYIGKPSMIKISENEATLLLFRTGTIRLMGRKNHVRLLQKFLKIIPNLKQISPLKLMSYTAVHDLNSLINLQILNCKKFFSNHELFPSSSYIHNSNEHVNIFSSGKVVIMGSKSINNINKLLENIKADLENGYFTWGWIDLKHYIIKPDVSWENVKVYDKKINLYVYHNLHKIPYETGDLEINEQEKIFTQNTIIKVCGFEKTKLVHTLCNWDYYDT